MHVVRDPDLPGQHHVVPDGAASGDTDLRGEQDAPPDFDAVPDLHEVVYLRTGADAGLTNGRPIDRRIRPDLDVVFDHDRGSLRNLQMGAVGLPGEPKTLAANDRAILQDDA